VDKVHTELYIYHMKKLWGVVLLFALLNVIVGSGYILYYKDNVVAGTTTKSPVTPEKYTPVVIDAPPNKDKLLELVNSERAKAGVAPLVLDERLNSSAQQKADEMEKDGYGHIDPVTGKQGYTYIFETTNHGCSIASENLDGASSSEEAIREWLASPPHKAAMLDNKYSLTGFGITPHQNYFFVVEHFCELR
jgi:uncharacterized protein YkwD